MDNSYRIAVASSDGIVVNQHFGHAGRFLIYEVESNGNFNLAEIRNTEPVCSFRNHDDEKLMKNMRMIQDCKYLLVSRIGNGASICAEQLGITAMELPDLIENSIRKIISYEQVQKLIGKE
ncbi:MAG: dinitrogenase iron-molybdenum cofactor biosynthesis protein [Ruminococcus sp.]|nr:dinitrogenase iron-molybdenum cofactor biosynthesis protein [Ruminococcus sp.]MCD8187079.1 dinitrogenase iron-molybdenum cofactor biosynthesis protein [Ruminococcus sp.]